MTKETGISIIFRDFQWITDDDLTDLCAHGTASITVGNNEAVELDGLCLTAGALYLLRSLYRNTSTYSAEFTTPDHLIPHCGHGWLATDGRVCIFSGCPIGLSWDVSHQGKYVHLTNFLCIREIGEHNSCLITPIKIDWGEYSKAVLFAADSVLSFHTEQPERQFVDNDEKLGYAAFWKEFNSLYREAIDRLN